MGEVKVKVTLNDREARQKVAKFQKELEKVEKEIEADAKKFRQRNLPLLGKLGGKVGSLGLSERNQARANKLLDKADAVRDLALKAAIITAIMPVVGELVASAIEKIPLLSGAAKAIREGSLEASQATVGRVSALAGGLRGVTGGVQPLQEAGVELTKEQLNEVRKAFTEDTDRKFQEFAVSQQRVAKAGVDIVKILLGKGN